MIGKATFAAVLVIAFVATFQGVESAPRKSSYTNFPSGSNRGGSYDNSFETSTEQATRYHGNGLFKKLLVTGYNVVTKNPIAKALKFFFLIPYRIFRFLVNIFLKPFQFINKNVRSTFADMAKVPVNIFKDVFRGVFQ